MTDKRWSPESPDKLRATGWRSKLPSGYRVWIFLGAAVLVGAGLVAVLR
jgi:hypothetical protein